MDLMTKRIVAGAVGCVAAIGVGLGIWQPWKANEAPPADDPPRQEEKVPQGEQLYLEAGGQKFPCTLVEKDGWSIYLPDGWVLEGSTLWPDRSKLPDTRLTILPAEDVQVPLGDFNSVWPSGKSVGRSFYTDSASRAFELRIWDGGELDKLLTAVVRSFTLDGAAPFARMPLSTQPDTQMDGDTTILFLDKLGLVVDDHALEAVRGRMLTWDREKRTGYTGGYQLAGPLVWSASYTMGVGSYADVFSGEAAYELLPGEGQKEQWEKESFTLTLLHDGESEKEWRPLWNTSVSPDQPPFLSLLTRPMDLTMTPEELDELAAWFNESENNGLLRFPYSDGTDPVQVGPSLFVLFHDLSQGTPSQEEKDALAKAGGMMELDIGRLPREYVVSLLQSKLGMNAVQAEETLKEEYAPGLGVYLQEFDCWYMTISDTMMGKYAFTSGVREPSGRCTVTYTHPGMYLAGKDGETDVLFDRTAEAVVSPAPGEAGGWIVESNKIVG